MDKKSVLLVEDAPEVRILVQASLHESCDLVVTTTVAEALQIIKQKAFDLFLIDIGLPDGDGFSLCTELSQQTKSKGIPVFFLTGKTETEDKVRGFSLGADDYIVKPFDPAELRARVCAKLKKSSERYMAGEVIEKGPFRLDLSSYKAKVIHNGAPKDLELSPHEFRLLLYFIRHEGHVLTRHQLLDSVWGTDVSVTDRTVDTHVCKLRKKIPLKKNTIQSIFREGYRFQIAT